MTVVLTQCRGRGRRSLKRRLGQPQHRLPRRLPSCQRQPGGLGITVAGRDRLQGLVFDQDAFTETGAGAINLHVQDESTSSAYGVLGTELAYALPAVLVAPLVVSGRVGWAHEYTERTDRLF